MRNYGEALKYQREILGLNQYELANKIGTSQQNISRWERGDVIPNIEFCVQLAEFYGITINELLGISECGATPTAAPMGERYSAEERQLIEDFRRLNHYKQELIKSNIKAMLPAEAESAQKKREN